MFPAGAEPGSVLGPGARHRLREPCPAIQGPRVNQFFCIPSSSVEEGSMVLILYGNSLSSAHVRSYGNSSTIVQREFILQVP